MPRPSSIVISVQYAGRTSADRLVDQFLSNGQFTKNRDEVYGESTSQPDPLQYGVKTRKPFRGTLRGELRSMNSLFQHETRVSQFRIVETVQPAGRVPYDQTSTM